MLRKLSFSRAPKKYPSTDGAAGGAAGDNPFTSGAVNPVGDGSYTQRTSFDGGSGRESFSEQPMPTPRSSFSGPRTSLTSLFMGNPDKTHDGKVAGLPIDPSITATKQALRRQRDAIESTAAFYLKFAEREKSKKSGFLPLTLPELAEWSRNELFCGDEASSRLLHASASQLVAIEAFINAERATLATTVCGMLRDESKSLCVRGIDVLQAFELEVLDASNLHDSGKKALKKATAAQTAGRNDEHKAASLKDEKKRPEAQAKAQRALEKAASDIAEAEGAIARAEAELARLSAEAQPAAAQAAATARREVEGGPLKAAAESLGLMYKTTAQNVIAMMRGEGPVPTEYAPQSKRAAPPKEDKAKFARYVVQWTLAKRRTKADAADVDEVSKAGLVTLLGPANEMTALELLASEVEDADVAGAFRGVAVPVADLDGACSACKEALETLSSVLGEFRVLIKAQVAHAAEYEKKEAALRALTTKRDGVDKQVATLSVQVEGGMPPPPGSKGATAHDKAVASLEKKRAELTKLNEEVSMKTTGLESAGADLESFAADLAGNSPRSVLKLVAEPMGMCVAAYGTFCATRAGDGSVAPSLPSYPSAPDSPFGLGGQPASTFGLHAEEPERPAWSVGEADPPAEIVDNPFRSGGGGADPFSTGGGGGDHRRRQRGPWERVPRSSLWSSLWSSLLPLISLMTIHLVVMGPIPLPWAERPRRRRRCRRGQRRRSRKRPRRGPPTWGRPPSPPRSTIPLAQRWRLPCLSRSRFLCLWRPCPHLWRPCPHLWPRPRPSRRRRSYLRDGVPSPTRVLVRHTT